MRFGFMNGKSWQFQKGNTPPSHKEGCGCFRCDPVNGKRSDLRGKPSPLRGRVRSVEVIEKIAAKNRGKIRTLESKAKTSNSMKNLPKEWFTANMRRNKKSGLEERVEAIINKNNLPYRFVGNGDFVIERKCPDFVNTNGKKIVVELYWNRHKEQFKGGGVEAWKTEREAIFAKYGYKTLFIEGSNVTNNQIVETLGERG
jgi:very-short-patch-repair endonuclease